MRVLPPIAIRDAMLTSTSVAESDYSSWASGTNYALGARVMIATRAATATISIASPAVFTWTAHALPEGTPVTLSTTGALPTGLAAGTVYFVTDPTADTFKLSASIGGGPIVTTGTQSGTHTVTAQIHRNYESLIASNVGNNPLADAAGTKWLDLGPTNRWAPFDTLRSTGATDAGPMSYVITPGERVDGCAVAGLVATSLTVSVSVSGSPVYSRTVDLSTRSVANWYEHFFSPFTYRSTYAFFDLPPYTTGVISVVAARSVGPVSMGVVVLGRSIYLGETQYSPTASALNFSTIERNAYGDAVLIKRRSVPKVSLRSRIRKEDAAKVVAAQSALNATPAFYSGIDDNTHGYFEPLSVFGVYRQLDLSMDYEDFAMIAGEIEEV